MLFQIICAPFSVQVLVSLCLISFTILTTTTQSVLLYPSLLFCCTLPALPVTTMLSSRFLTVTFLWLSFVLQLYKYYQKLCMVTLSALWHPHCYVFNSLLFTMILMIHLYWLNGWHHYCLNTNPLHSCSLFSKYTLRIYFLLFPFLLFLFLSCSTTPHRSPCFVLFSPFNFKFILVVSIIYLGLSGNSFSILYIFPYWYLPFHLSKFLPLPLTSPSSHHLPSMLLSYPSPPAGR